MKKEPSKTQYVRDAIAGKYEFNTGGADKKGKRPGFSKKGSVDAKNEKRMKGMAPTHGGSGAC